MSDKTDPPAKARSRLISHAELVAMADIDEALVSLGDPAAVRRVLDWVDAKHYPADDPRPAAADPDGPRR